eukprot:4401462-Ditylum_brightwellii.AAC.1
MYYPRKPNTDDGRALMPWLDNIDPELDQSTVEPIPEVTGEQEDPMADKVKESMDINTKAEGEEVLDPSKVENAAAGLEPYITTKSEQVSWLSNYLTANCNMW